VNKIVYAVAGVAVAATLIACGSGATNDGKPMGPNPTASVVMVPPDAPKYHTPVPGDFTLTVKILQQHCFGSAGCNVDFRINLSGGGELDPNQTYELTYEVKGGKEPHVSTMTVTGKDYLRLDREFIHTPNKSSKLTATVVSVEAL
jgi:hypothetical protein